jgi:hypothetical protein
MKQQKGLQVNKWIGTGTIRKMEFIKEFNKYRFLLEQPEFIKVMDPNTKALVTMEHLNLFSINAPAALNKMLEEYTNGDFIYMEGCLSQSDNSQYTKVRLIYLKHFDPVYIEASEVN